MSFIVFPVIQTTRAPAGFKDPIIKDPKHKKSKPISFDGTSKDGAKKPIEDATALIAKLHLGTN